MSKEIGTLVVVVLKARNLPDKHTIHKQDAFAQATLNKSTQKTKVDIRGGQHPVWDDELRFPIVKHVSDETRKLEVHCYSKEPRSDDLIGHGSIDVSDTLKTGEFDDWIPLQTEDGQHRGDIFLEMTYYSAAPPPQRRPSKWIPADRLKPTAAYSYSSGAGSKPKSHKTPVTSAQSLTAVLKDNALPPLPEESVAEPMPPTSIPSILRPGGSAPGRKSPKSNVNAGPLPPEHPVHTQSPYTPHRNSSPTSRVNSSRPTVDSIPPYLRPAGGAPIPINPPKSNPGLPPPDHFAHTQSPYTPPLNSTPPLRIHNSHSSLDSNSIPTYLRPAGGVPNPSPQPYTPNIPEPQIPTPNISALHGSPPRFYVSTPLPQAQPYTAPYGSPHEYSHYGAPPVDYGPYGTAAPLFRPPQAPRSPPPQPYPPYAYGGNPYPNGWEHERERGPELPDPYLQARYQTPLPLPEGARASTPSHPSPQPQPQPQPQAQPPPSSQSQPQPQSQPQVQAQPPSASTIPQATSTQPLAVKKPKRVQPSREERDRQLALEIEEEEEVRRRKLREQEERDMELARQLDLELNLQAEKQAAAAAAAGSAAPPTSTGSGGAAPDMPGGW